jgi:hypothetical protein
MRPITISAYTTTRNCVEMDYPFEESIRSMLAFADEVVVLDTSDAEDATPARLEAMAKEDPRVKVLYANKLFDWSAPNHGIFDGQTKAMARAACKSDFLWQFDVDEIVHEDDAAKIKPFIQRSNYLQQCAIIGLPVIEYWGSKGKVRADINPWKARLSRNLPDITHGIPLHLRRKFNGLDYASPGTDTCDYISKTTGQPLPVMTFVDQNVEGVRQMCLKNPKLVPSYEKWFNHMVKELPGVHHYSWFSIERKIRQYKMFWTSFWKAMYGPDSAQNKDPNWNPFFEVPWPQVTQEMIVQKAQELETKTGGHIFHSRWDGKTSTPSVTIHRDHPKVIQEWVKSHG